MRRSRQEETNMASRAEKNQKYKGDGNVYIDS
jgi:hypothetical protein